MICCHSKDCNVHHKSNSKARPNHKFDSDVVSIVCNFLFVHESDNYLRTSLGLTINPKLKTNQLFHRNIQRFLILLIIS